MPFQPASGIFPLGIQITRCHWLDSVKRINMQSLQNRQNVQKGDGCSGRKIFEQTFYCTVSPQQDA
jgi:hypothetical protein